MPEEEVQPITEPSLDEIKAIVAGKNPASEAAPAATPEPKPKAPEAPTQPAAGEPPAAVVAKPESTEAAPGTAPETHLPEPEVPPAPKKPGGLERRFSKLTRERQEAIDRAERAERELAEARKPASAATPAAKQEEGEPVPPDPSNWSGTYEELEAARLKYAKDIATWMAKQNRKEIEADLQRRAEEADGTARQRRLQVSWEEKARKTLASNPEFQEAIDAVGPIATRLGMAELIQESDVGPEIVTALYEDPEEMDRISSLPNPLAVARELGKIEARIVASKAKPAPKPVAVPAAPLPKPPATPGGGGVAAEPALEDLPMGQFKTTVRAQMRS